MDGLYVDGILMCKLINLIWRKKIPRLSFDMSGMAVDLFSYLNSNSDTKTIYFIGAKQDSLEKSIQHIKESYPNINIKGFRNGYFSSEKERIDAIDNIISLNPDYIIVGMGSPLQEKFCIELKNRGFQGIAFTCGGFLHQTAKRINYYPAWINKYNLRAFYRLANEKGLWGRLWKVFIQFPYLFIADSIRTKFSK
ncbi:MAG: WecB/TagA/CpsF family glycosyltransferase [Muribaculaceae bacterium]|nr:WecB/TagA/CpsF family glycosyltransferase [Muribaculaceae bacterium]